PLQQHAGPSFLLGAIIYGRAIFQKQDHCIGCFAARGNSQILRSGLLFPEAGWRVERTLKTLRPGLAQPD
ncbi:MAG TPA: hypothetical protein VGK81_11760, partial [Anaerolineae bacterium]